MECMAGAGGLPAIGNWKREARSILHAQRKSWPLVWSQQKPKP